jgi:rieske iron-sulfur protein
LAKKQEGSGVRSDRRNLLIGGAGLLMGLSLGPGALEAAKKPDRLPPQIGDRLMITRGPHKDKFLRPEMLGVGEKQVEGFPFGVEDNVLRRRNRLNRLVFVRVEPDAIDADVAPRAADGVLVYSAVCTHKGCTIKSWMAEKQHLRCHCHLSEFAVLTGGSVHGGPARAPLPMLGVAIDDEGYVIVVEVFNRKPGFKS